MTSNFKVITSSRCHDDTHIIPYIGIMRENEATRLIDVRHQQEQTLHKRHKS